MRTMLNQDWSTSRRLLTMAVATNTGSTGVPKRMSVASTRMAPSGSPAGVIRSSGNCEKLKKPRKTAVPLAAAMAGPGSAF
jgi:hypothetical protein